MPAYDVAADYKILIAAPRQRVWDKLLNADFTCLPVARRLMWLRSFGRPPETPDHPRTLATLGERGAGGFLELVRVPQQEIVLGVIGRFWRPDAPVLRGWKPEEFSSISPPGQAKAAWNFYLEDSGDATLLSTETRVQCTGRAARIKFRLYWTLIGFFSGLIRREILRLVKENCEQAGA